MSSTTSTPVGNSRRPAQRGVGLIEVMIALLVMSIGILALVGMQLSGKKANYDAVQRTTATHLAWDLVERARANSEALDDYVVEIGDALGEGELDEALCSSEEPCSQSQMAAADLYEWEQQLIGAAEETAGGAASGGLVAPRACLEDLGGGEYQVTVAWRGTTELSDADPVVDACGEGVGSPYGDDGEFRRFVSIRFFVNS